MIRVPRSWGVAPRWSTVAVALLLLSLAPACRSGKGPAEGGAPAPPPAPPAAPRLATTVAPAPAVDAGMARLPGGSYVHGESRTLVTVDPFLLEESLVSARAYDACVQAGRCTSAGRGGSCSHGDADRMELPANCVTWSQAHAYCTWKGRRLPSDLEWEWAARGADRGTPFPWGYDPQPDAICWNGPGNARGDGNRTGPCPVAGDPRTTSPQGVKDLLGNVYQFTSARADAGLVVVRGLAWGDDEPRLLVGGHRKTEDPDYARNAQLGLRCARSNDLPLPAPPEPPARVESSATLAPGCWATDRPRPVACWAPGTVVSWDVRFRVSGKVADTRLVERLVEVRGGDAHVARTFGDRDPTSIVERALQEITDGSSTGAAPECRTWRTVTDLGPSEQYAVESCWKPGAAFPVRVSLGLQPDQTEFREGHRDDLVIGGRKFSCQFYTGTGAGMVARLWWCPDVPGGIGKVDLERDDGDLRTTKTVREFQGTPARRP